jgi:sugar diacid utilization regulator
VTASGNDPAVRNLLSSLRALLALTTLMTECGDEDEIVGLATAAISSLCTSSVSGLRPTDCHAEGAYLDGRWRAVDTWDPRAGDRPKLEAQLLECDAAGGPLEIPGQAWGWAYSLSTTGGASGYLVVGAEEEPSEDVQFLLRTLAQQASVALANDRLHARQRLTAEELRVANSSLRLRIEIHERLTQVVTAGEGQTGIARAVHELTGYPVVVEDRWGTLRAWAGPDRPKVHPRAVAEHREPLLRRMLQAGHPIRDNDRLFVVASPREDVVGVLALVDPDGTAGEKEQVALEHGATVLAMELARLASLAETELRQRRDLVEELLAGDEEGAFNRAQSLGYDLGRPHRVVVVTGGSHNGEEETLFHAVRRAARDLEAGSLLVARAGEVVLFSDKDASWTRFGAAVDSALRGGHCRIGIGAVCERPRDFARSHREAQLALKMQKAMGGGQGVTQFEDLGVYQVLSELPDIGSVERFVRRWLGPLMDHDAAKGSQLVATLSGYLESGGHYDTAADLLVVHRSTLKYRLQQIRTVTGYDLGDADTSFNLHLAARAWRTLEAMRDP